MKSDRSRSALFRVVVVAVAGITVQGIHLASGDRDPTFETPIVDAGVYHQAAQAFSGGEAWIDDAYWQPPLFPMFLGCVYAVCGPSIFAAKMVLASLAVLSCLLIQRIGGRLFSPRVGTLAGVMAALYGPFVFFSTQLLPVGLAVFLNLLAVVIWLRCLDEQRRNRWFGLGVVVGLATITVPNSAVLLVVALGDRVWCLVRRREASGAVLGMGLLCMGAAIPIGAVAIRNYTVSGEIVLISTNGGVNFYIGNNAKSDAMLAIRPGEPWKRFLREGYRDGAQTRSGHSAFYFRESLKEIAAAPGVFLGGLCRKVLRLLNGYEIPRNLDLYVFREFSPLLYGLVWRAGPFSFPFGILAPLAAVGIVGSLRGASPNGHRGRQALATFVLLYGASVACFFVSSRFRLPPAMLLIVFAAGGAMTLWSGLVATFRSTDHVTKNSVGVRLGRPTAIVLVLTAIAANLPLALPTDGHDYRAELDSFVGQVHVSQGRLVKGEQFLRQSLARHPQDPSTAAALANVLFRTGEADSAFAILDEAIRRLPQTTGPRLSLANAQGRLGRMEEAAANFEAVLALDDTSPGAHAGLADMFIATDRAANAVEHYRSAMAFAEEPGSIELRLADALVRIESYEEAIERYRRGLWRVDGDAETLTRVAWLLATCPRVELRDCEQAIRLAERACTLTDYENASGLDTLAAGYAECGRFQEALTWVKAAIDIAKKAGNTTVVEAFEMRRRIYAGRLESGGTGPTHP